MTTNVSRWCRSDAAGDPMTVMSLAPVDSAHPTELNGRRTLPITLDPPSWQLLHALAVSCDASAVEVLVAAFLVLVAKYSGETDISVLGAVPSSVAALVTVDDANHRSMREVTARVRAADHLAHGADDSFAADVILTITDVSDSPLTAGLSFDAGIHEDEAVAATHHFHTLLIAAIKAPDAPVADLCMLTSTEATALLAAENGPARPVDMPVVHAAVAAAAAAWADKTAVVAADGTLSYGQVVRTSHQLARHLAAQGVGPGALVAVCLPRSTVLVPALLAVLEAGAAYVPIDPGYPPERVTHMVSDAGVAAMITVTGLLPMVEQSIPHGIPVILFDADDDGDAGTRPVRRPSLPRGSFRSISCRPCSHPRRILIGRCGSQTSPIAARRTSAGRVSTPVI